MKKIIVLTWVLINFTSSACVNGENNDGIVPKNNLKIPIRAGYITGISKRSFDSIIKTAKIKFSSDVSAIGGRLVIKKKWRNATVNAYAEKKGSKRLVTMFGGFARHPLVTEDVFRFVVCHEIGHHIGGEPMIHNVRELWASNEGQSDYYAGTKCMRKLLIDEDNISFISSVKVPEIVKVKCDKSFNNENQKALCQRISMAGLGLASVFRSLRNSKEISFSTPDPKEVWRTWFLHPIPQCRLDTYFRSAICSVDHNIDLSYDDETTGFCSRENDQEYGARPRCWFTPGRTL